MRPWGSRPPRIVASIEARMGSSRLPGKTLAEVAGEPALTRLLSRLRRCRTLDGIILATTTSSADDALADWAHREGVAVYRGSEDDVLQRVVEAHATMGSEVVVEVTGDCVLLDPEIIDWGVETYLANDCDVVTNVRQASFPLGADVQVFGWRLLAEVAQNVADPAVREHVSLYFYEHPERYRVIHLMAPSRWAGAEYRFQLDYPEDLRFLTEVFQTLEPLCGADFGVAEVLELVRANPQLAAINRDCEERAPR